jgi:hypothetical protein
MDEPKQANEAPIAEPPNPAPAGEPEDPVDAPLLDMLSTLDDEGYRGQFRADAGGRLCCLTCGATFEASAVRADELSRLEGASDPSDMLIVIPLVCPACDTHGTLIANYGPEASAEEAEVLQSLRRTPSEGSNAAEPTPGVT